MRLTLACMLAACSAPSPRPDRAQVVLTAPPPSAPVPSPPAEAPVAAACRNLHVDHAIVTAGSVFAQKLDPRSDDEALVAATFGECIMTPHGAWALTFTAIGQEDVNDVACWAIVHVDAKGRLAQAFPEMSGSGAKASCSPGDPNLQLGPFWNGAGFAEPRLFDFDGNGDPEIFVARRGDQNNIDTRGSDAVWTFKEGKVVPYPPAAGVGVIALVDEDHDGRLDLLTHGPFRSDHTYACGLQSMDVYPVTGPELVVHALPDGKFSADDGVARTAALRGCPHAPPQIDSGIDMACARLWGATEGQIHARLNSCAPNCGGINPCCPDWCDQDRHTVTSWSATPPPVRLDQP